MPSRFDVVMIGAGIVGLAAAMELHQRHPHLKMAVLDKEQKPGLHQSGHNSLRDQPPQWSSIPVGAC